MPEPGVEEDCPDMYATWFEFKYQKYGNVPTEPMDFLWYKPGSVHYQYTNPSYLAKCRRCDVYEVFEPGTYLGRPRCWSCGRYIKRPTSWHTGFKNYGFNNSYEGQASDRAVQERIRAYIQAHSGSGGLR